MTSEQQVFTEAEAAYLTEGRRLGRLATVAADGSPQNNPVGYHLDPLTGDLDVYGRNLAETRKFRNVKGNPHVAIVVDDIASLDPWVVRGVEVRGVAEALDGVAVGGPGVSQAVIRIHPRRVVSWGVDPTNPGMTTRDVVTDVAFSASTPSDAA